MVRTFAVILLALAVGALYPSESLATVEEDVAWPLLILPVTNLIVTGINTVALARGHADDGNGQLAMITGGLTGALGVALLFVDAGDGNNGPQAAGTFTLATAALNLGVGWLAFRSNDREEAVSLTTVRSPFEQRHALALNVSF